MVLKEKTRILQSKNAKTQYITVPSAVVSVSQYPFNANDEVEIEVIPAEKKTESKLVVRFAEQAKGPQKR